MKTNPEQTTPTNLSWLKNCDRHWDEWCKRQGRTRLRLFWTGLVTWAALSVVLAWYVKHFPHPVAPDPRAYLLCFGVMAATVLFFIAWPLVCFRFKKNKLDGTKFNPTKPVVG